MESASFEIKRRPFLIAAVKTAPAQNHSPLPLQQHPLYVAALKSVGADAEEIMVLHAGKPVLQGYFLHKRFAGALKLTISFRGPQWCNPAQSNDIKIAALKFLRAQFSPWRWNFISLMPDVADTKENKQMINSAGFRRVLTGSSTIWLDLAPDEAILRSNLDGVWRNQLKKAEQATFTLSFGGTKAKHYNWLLEREKDQRQNKGYGAVPIGIVPAYHQAASRLKIKHQPIVSVSAIEKGNKIAGALFLLHGNSATYHIGWAGERARELNAQNRILFAGVLALKKQGVKWLDLGGIDTGPQAGVTRFKLGTGGKPHTATGTYI